VLRTAPTKLLLKDGCQVYTDTPHRELQRVVESARKRGDEDIRIGTRGYRIDRIVKVLAPAEVTQ